jgi:hypothetical protein
VPALAPSVLESLWVQVSALLPNPPRHPSAGLPPPPASPTTPLPAYTLHESKRLRTLEETFVRGRHGYMPGFNSTHSTV